jgi:hypothetical protein
MSVVAHTRALTRRGLPLALCNLEVANDGRKTGARKRPGLDARRQNLHSEFQYIRASIRRGTLGTVRHHDDLIEEEGERRGRGVARA